MIFNGTAEELVDLAWCYAEAEWFPKNLEVDPCYFDGKAHPTWCLSDPESLTRSAIRPQVAAAIIFAHAYQHRCKDGMTVFDDGRVRIGSGFDLHPSMLHALLDSIAREAPSTPA